jgi:hypothetical protein
MEIKKTISWIKGERGFIILASLFVFLLHNPFTVLIPQGGLDQSYIVGLEWAKLKGFFWGSDIVFTYGPLSFLYSCPVELAYPSVFLEELLYLFVYLVVVLAMMQQFSRLLFKKAWKEYAVVEQILIILGISTFAFVPMALTETILVLVCILFVRLIFEVENSKANRKRYWFYILFITILLSTVCMVKFTYIMAALALIVIASVGLIYKKKPIWIAYIIFFVLFFNILFWLVCGQLFSNLLNYYTYGFELSFGHTEALMDSDGYYYELKFGVFCFCITALLGCFSLWLYFVKKDFYRAFILFIALPLLFVAFKQSFVRSDIWHTDAFFFQLLPVIVFYIIFFVPASHFPYRKSLHLFLIGLLFITTTAIVNLYHFNYQEIERFSPAKIWNLSEERINKNKAHIREREYDPLPEEFYTSKESVDIFPWDVSLLYAYELNWSPRPVFQSYIAYTSVLDSLNAQHFKGNTAPEKIIYSYKSVYREYPLFSEPAVFRTLLGNYDIQSLDYYLIMQHRAEKIQYDYTPLTNGVCPVGTIIDVPQMPEHHIYCNIDVSINWTGKLINILYKPSPIYIRFYIKGKPEPVEHIFIRKLGMDGLYVSKYAVDLSDVCSIFEENFEQDIEKIQISIEPNYFYKPEMNYEFYAAPYSGCRQIQQINE